MPKIAKKKLLPIVKNLLQMHEAGYDNDTLTTLLQRELAALGTGKYEQKAINLLSQYFNENSGSVRPHVIIPLQAETKKFFAHAKVEGIEPNA